MIKFSYYGIGRVLSWVNRIFTMCTDDGKEPTLWDISLLSREVQPSMRRAMDDRSNEPFLQASCYFISQSGYKVNCIYNSIHTIVSNSKPNTYGTDASIPEPDISLNIAMVKFDRDDHLINCFTSDNNLTILIDKRILAFEDPVEVVRSIWRMCYYLASHVDDGVMINARKLKNAAICCWFVRNIVNLEAKDFSEYRTLGEILGPPYGRLADITDRLKIAYDTHSIMSMIDTLLYSFEDGSNDIWNQLIDIIALVDTSEVAKSGCYEYNKEDEKKSTLEEEQ